MRNSEAPLAARMAEPRRMALDLPGKRSFHGVTYSALSISYNHAANGQGQQSQSDDSEPEWPILRASDRVAEQEDDQQQKLHLHDPDDYSKHGPRPNFIPAGAVSCGAFLLQSSHLMTRRSSDLR